MDFDTRGYDAVLEPGMVMCVESYMGAEDGHEGVKLEEQVLVTDTGIEQLSSYPLDL
jgi:Xaa-Pro aminopeptidase